MGRDGDAQLHRRFHACLDRISSTRLIFPSLPPEVIDLSVRVPIRMSVCDRSAQALPLHSSRLTAILGVPILCTAA